MQLRQAASLHLALFALDFIAPSASLPLAGVKFVPYNTPAFPITQIL
jgi:hypothetical protein